MKIRKRKRTDVMQQDEMPTKAATSRPENSLAETFARIDQIRKRIKPLPDGLTIKHLIEEGRR